MPWCGINWHFFLKAVVLSVDFFFWWPTFEIFWAAGNQLKMVAENGGTSCIFEKRSGKQQIVF